MKIRKKLLSSKPIKKSKKKRNFKNKIIIENKKRFEEIKKEELQQNEDLEDEEEIEFSEGFKLNPITRSQGLEHIPVGGSLEEGLIFAPRIRDKKDKEGKNYSETKYEVKYDSNYGEKTPNEYASNEPLPDTPKEEKNPNQ
jgi:hypothetical protein